MRGNLRWRALVLKQLHKSGKKSRLWVGFTLVLIGVSGCIRGALRLKVYRIGLFLVVLIDIRFTAVGASIL